MSVKIITLSLLCTLINIGANCQIPIILNSGSEYDVSSAYFSGIEFEVFAQEPRPSSIAFNNDGTNMYIIGTRGESLVEYDLTIPFEINSAVYTGLSNEIYLGAFGYPESIAFNEEGTKLFVLFYDRSLYEFTLGSPFDLSTAEISLDSKSIEPDIDNAQAICFGDQGKYLFIGSSNRIGTYHLDQEYDVSTANYMGIENDFNLGSIIHNLSFRFNNDGTKLFVSTGKVVKQFSLSSSFNLSTATYDGVTEDFDFEKPFDTIKDFIFLSDGLRMNALLEAQSGDRVIEYMLPSSIEFEENTGTPVFNVDAIDNQDGGIDENIEYNLQGPDAELFLIESGGEISFLSPPDFENPEDANTNNVYNISVIADNGVLNASMDLAVIVIDIPDSPIFTRPNQGYDITTASYLGIDESYYVAVQEDRMDGFVFNNDGSKMYVFGEYSKGIIEYKLDINFDVSTSNYEGSEKTFKLSIQEEAFPTGVVFSLDGKKMFVSINNIYISSEEHVIQEYILSTAFDISTASYAGSAEDFYPPIRNAGPSDLEFNNDGTRMFILLLGVEGNAISEYWLSVPYDISTAEYAGVEQELYIGNKEAAPRGICFSSDGTKLFVIGTQKESAFSYHVKTPFDVSSARYIAARNISDDMYYPGDIAFNSEGTRMFISSRERDIVGEYVIGASLEFSENSTGVVADVDAEDGIGGSVDISVSYSLAGPDASVFNIDDSGLLVFNDIPDFEKPIDQVGNNMYQFTVIAETLSDRSDLTMNITVFNENDFPIFVNNDAGYNTASATYTGHENEYDVNLEETSPQSLAFNQDGTKMYLLGADFMRVLQYDLTVPFDISSSYCSDLLDLSGTLSRSIAFNSDGSKMYILYESGILIEYNLVEPFNLSTTNTDNLKELNLLDQDNNPTDFAFNKDGSKFYVLGAEDKNVVEFILQDPFDISTSIPSNDNIKLHIGDQLDDPRALSFSQDGYKMFILGANENAVWEYSLEIAFDISTAKTFQTQEYLSIDNQVHDPVDMVFNNTGTRLFIVSNAAARIVEYELPIILDIDEKSTPGGYDINAHDGLGGDVDSGVMYSLEGSDTPFFTIDETGLLILKFAPAYDNPIDSNSDNIYEVEVIADNGLEQSSLIVEFHINSIPKINDQSFSIDEGSETDLIVGEIEAIDADGDKLLFNIVSGNINDAFDLSTDGVLSVSKTEELVHDTNPSYSLSVRVIDANGAEAVALISVNINKIVLSVDDNELFPGLIMYPNPASSILTIDDLTGHKTGKFIISLLNSNGSIVKYFERQLTPYHQMNLDVSDLPAGIYMLVLKEEDKSVANRVIIIK